MVTKSAISQWPPSTAPVDHGDVVADLTVVAGMALHHEVAVVPDTGRGCRVRCGVDGHVLAERAVAADLDAGRRRPGLELEVLRLEPDARVGIERAAVADLQRALHLDVGDQLDVVAEGDVTLEHAPRSDLDVVSEFDVLSDDRRRVDDCRVAHRK